MAERGVKELKDADWEHYFEVGMEQLFTTKEADKHFWQLLTDVPKAKNVFIAVFCALANIVVPGSGCIAISLFGDARQAEWSMDKTNFVVGIV